MKERLLYDITDVCNMLGITSRTLRFYEEKGVIQSTTLYNSSRRQYTKEQIDNIRNVLVLRTLGLSLKSISDLQAENISLKDAVVSKRAEIFAQIDTKKREIKLLDEALSVISSGESVFEKDLTKDIVSPDEKKADIVRACSAAVIDNNEDGLYKYLGERLTERMPKEVYLAVREDVLEPLGDFVCVDKMEFSVKEPNTIHQFVKYSKLGLKITFVFLGEKIEGFWLNYYEI